MEAPMAKRLVMSIAVLLLGWCIANQARADGATLVGRFIYNSDTNNFQETELRFVNPNDISVDLTFVVLVKDSSTSGSGYWVVDDFVATDDGVQTIALPAHGQVWLHTFNIDEIPT
jgi:hypothetical protein